MVCYYPSKELAEVWSRYTDQGGDSTARIMRKYPVFLRCRDVAIDIVLVLELQVISNLEKGPVTSSTVWTAISGGFRAGYRRAWVAVVTKALIVRRYSRKKGGKTSNWKELRCRFDVVKGGKEVQKFRRTLHIFLLAVVIERENEMQRVRLSVCEPGLLRSWKARNPTLDASKA